MLMDPTNLSQSKELDLILDYAVNTIVNFNGSTNLGEVVPCKGPL